MIRQELQNTLFQFKRVHKNQIAPHRPVLSQKTEEMIHRKTLNTLDESSIKQLVNQIIEEINQYQSNREKPHQGLKRFKHTLLSQL